MQLNTLHFLLNITSSGNEREKKRNKRCIFCFLRPSIVERMPVLINNQTPTANNGEQQEPIYDPDESLTNDQHTNHVASNQPVDDLLKMLDGPVESNGDLFGMDNHNYQQQQQQQTSSTSNPLEELLFGNDFAQTSPTITTPTGNCRALSLFSFNFEFIFCFSNSTNDSIG